jgi:carboxylesterase type B
MASKIVLAHPQLGDILGCDGSIVNFRGIPYATLQDKFAQAQLLTSYPDPLDATQYG